MDDQNEDSIVNQSGLESAEPAPRLSEQTASDVDRGLIDERLHNQRAGRVERIAERGSEAAAPDGHTRDQAAPSADIASDSP